MIEDFEIRLKVSNPETILCLHIYYACVIFSRILLLIIKDQFYSPSFCHKKNEIFQWKCFCWIIYSRITIFVRFLLFKWIVFKSIVWHIREIFLIFHPVSNYKKCHKFCIMKTNPIKFRSSHEKNVKGSPFRKLANVVLIEHFITVLLVFFFLF